MAQIELIRAGQHFPFDSIDENGVITKMDTKPELGGEGYGARPMQLLLNALAGCASIDILQILKKRKQQISDYKVTVQGEREAEKEPSLWKEIFITFMIDGDVDRLSAKKARIRPGDSLKDFLRNTKMASSTTFRFFILAMYR